MSELELYEDDIPVAIRLQLAAIVHNGNEAYSRIDAEEAERERTGGPPSGERAEGYDPRTVLDGVLGVFASAVTSTGWLVLDRDNARIVRDLFAGAHGRDVAPFVVALRVTLVPSVGPVLRDVLHAFPFPHLSALVVEHDGETPDDSDRWQPLLPILGRGSPILQLVYFRGTERISVPSWRRHPPASVHTLRIEGSFPRSAHTAELVERVAHRRGGYDRLELPLFAVVHAASAIPLRRRRGLRPLSVRRECTLTIDVRNFGDERDADLSCPLLWDYVAYLMNTERIVLRWTDARIPSYAARVPPPEPAGGRGERLANTATIAYVPLTDGPSGVSITGAAEMTRRSTAVCLMFCDDRPEQRHRRPQSDTLRTFWEVDTQAIWIDPRTMCLGRMERLSLRLMIFHDGLPSEHMAQYAHILLPVLDWILFQNTYGPRIDFRVVLDSSRVDDPPADWRTYDPREGFAQETYMLTEDADENIQPIVLDLLDRGRIAFVSPGEEMTDRDVLEFLGFGDEPPPPPSPSPSPSSHDSGKRMRT